MASESDPCDLCGKPADPSSEECMAVFCISKCHLPKEHDIYHSDCLKKYLRAFSRGMNVARPNGYSCPKGKGRGTKAGGYSCAAKVAHSHKIIIKSNTAQVQAPDAGHSAAIKAADTNKAAGKGAKTPAAAAAAAPKPVKTKLPALNTHKQKIEAYLPTEIVRLPPVPDRPSRDPLGRNAAAAAANAAATARAAKKNAKRAAARQRKQQQDQEQGSEAAGAAAEEWQDAEGSDDEWFEDLPDDSDAQLTGQDDDSILSPAGFSHGLWDRPFRQESDMSAYTFLTVDGTSSPGTSTPAAAEAISRAASAEQDRLAKTIHIPGSAAATAAAAGTGFVSRSASVYHSAASSAAPSPAAVEKQHASGKPMLPQLQMSTSSSSRSTAAVDMHLPGSGSQHNAAQTTAAVDNAGYSSDFSSWLHHKSSAAPDGSSSWQPAPATSASSGYSASISNQQQHWAPAGATAAGSATAAVAANAASYPTPLAAVALPVSAAGNAAAFYPTNTQPQQSTAPMYQPVQAQQQQQQQQPGYVAAYTTSVLGSIAAPSYNTHVMPQSSASLAYTTSWTAQQPQPQQQACNTKSLAEYHRPAAAVSANGGGYYPASTVTPAAASAACAVPYPSTWYPSASAAVPAAVGVEGEDSLDDLLALLGV